MLNKIESYNFIALFTNNGYENGFRPAVASSVGLIKEISFTELERCPKPVIPIISYDLKNVFENLTSKNNCAYYIEDLKLIEPDSFEFIEPEKMNDYLTPSGKLEFDQIKIVPKVSKDDYLKNVANLKKHIQQGDIYEVNYCIEFTAQNVELDAFELFKKYNSISLSPMSCFIKYNDLYIICCSPERFLKRTNNEVTSEPIKGTRKRSIDDELMISELRNDQKERAENIMIVDLVRNDLSRIAKKGTVTVDELCKIHTFPTIHQSISKISCQVDESCTFEQILKATFPMGSMTGAPKISAMKLIDEAENSKRQIYSGSTGYIEPNGDFDLNVIIRTIIYDKKNKYLSFMVGSAITQASDAEKEYEECLVKASAMIKAMNTAIE